MILFNVAQTDFSDNVTTMAQRGIEYLQLDDLENAIKISNTVNELEPNNETAKILKKSIDFLKANPPAKPGGLPNPAKRGTETKPVIPGSKAK